MFPSRIVLLAMLILISLAMVPRTVVGQNVGGSGILLRVVESCPDGYAATPDGCVPSDCVFGSVSSFDIASGNMTFDNGTRAVAPGHCLTGFPVILKKSVYSNGTTTSTIVPARAASHQYPFPTNNWVEDTDYCDLVYDWLGRHCASFASFSADWLVPNTPDSWDGQLMYLFIAFEDDYTFPQQIIQPVLQWGVSPAGGGNYYAMADWFCPGGSTCLHSQLLTVNSGDRLYGNLWSAGSNVWNVIISDGGNGPSVSQTWTTRTMYWAWTALEVYGVQRCSDYPHPVVPPFTIGHTTFNDISIHPGNPGWTGEIRINDGCGENTGIQQGNGGMVTLYY